MLGDEVHRFCYPDLLHQERSAKAEPLQASLEGVRILAEKPFQYDVVLNYNKLSEMSVGPVSYTHLDVYKRQSMDRGATGY